MPQTDPEAAGGLRAADVVRTLEELAPSSLAEDWDNVGLLLGDRNAPVASVLTCLTLTEDVAAEAVESRAGLVVTHHPVLFRGAKLLTTDSAEGRIVLQLVQAGVAVYSPHTAYDSARLGVNAQLAELFGLVDVRPLRPADDLSDVGGGRFGELANEAPLSEFVARLTSLPGQERLQFVGRDDREVRRVAVACGSAGEFLGDAIRLGCDLFVTGETRFHTCLEARTADVGLVLLGHYASERPAVERLAELVAERHPDLDVAASHVERDPIRWT